MERIGASSFRNGDLTMVLVKLDRRSCLSVALRTRLDEVQLDNYAVHKHPRQGVAGQAPQRRGTWPSVIFRKARNSRLRCLAKQHLTPPAPDLAGPGRRSRSAFRQGFGDGHRPGIVDVSGRLEDVSTTFQGATT